MVPDERTRVLYLQGRESRSVIGMITGRLLHREDDHVLVDVHGVGILVHCSERTIQELPERGERVSFYTELVVREDLLMLIGFRTRTERMWHRLLTRVQGVGFKAALAITGTLGTEALLRAVTLEDAAAIRAAPGVGPKLAQRVVTELKDSAAEVMALGAEGEKQAEADAGGERRMDAAAVAATIATGGPDTVDVPGVTGDPVRSGEGAAASAEARREALSALVNLGYAHGEAAGAVAEAMKADGPHELETLIRAALVQLAPRR